MKGWFSVLVSSLLALLTRALRWDHFVGENLSLRVAFLRVARVGCSPGFRSCLVLGFSSRDKPVWSLPAGALCVLSSGQLRVAWGVACWPDRNAKLALSPAHYVTLSRSSGIPWHCFPCSPLSGLQGLCFEGLQVADCSVVGASFLQPAFQHGTLPCLCSLKSPGVPLPSPRRLPPGRPPRGPGPNYALAVSASLSWAFLFPAISRAIPSIFLTPEPMPAGISTPHSPPAVNYVYPTTVLAHSGGGMGNCSSHGQDRGVECELSWLPGRFF